METERNIISLTKRKLNGVVNNPSVQFSRAPETEECKAKVFYPLSSAQKRLFILQQIDGTNTAFNATQVVDFYEKPDSQRVVQVLKQLITRHESLRTSFHIMDSGPVQMIHPVRDSGEIGLEDLGCISGEHFGLLNASVEEFVKPFDLSSSPLLRMGTLQWGEKYFLVVDMHRIITDDVSQRKLIGEFDTLYRGQFLPQLKQNYIEYLLWQVETKYRETIDGQESYWMEEFSGELPVMELPYDFPRPVTRSFEGSFLEFYLSREETELIKEFCSKWNVTLFTLLLSFYYVLLSRLSGREDVVVGTPANGRPHADLEGVIGLFANTLAIRIQPEGNKIFTFFLDEVKQKISSAFENQEFPFENLVEALPIQKDLSRNPVFDTKFVLESRDDYSESENENKDNIELLELPVLGIHLGKSEFDLTLNCREGDGRIYFHLEYCTALFKAETIVRYGNYYKEIIASVLRDPDQSIAEINILPEPERQQLFYEFNDTSVPYPSNHTLHGLFEKQVRRTPERLAIRIVTIDVPKNSPQEMTQSLLRGSKGSLPLAHPAEGPPEGRRRQVGKVCLTYRELDDKANQTAQLLIAAGVKPGMIVGLVTDNALKAVVGILGILKAGGAYLPLDPGHSQEHRKFMLADSGASVVISSTCFMDCLREKLGYNGLLVNLDEIWVREDKAELPIVDEKSPAYIIYTNIYTNVYTNGSAGNPQGVLVEHGNVVNTLLCRRDEYRMNGGHVSLQLFSYGFDGFVTSFFTPLISGSEVVLLNRDQVTDPVVVRAAVIENGVTHLLCMPTLYREVLEQLTREEASVLETVTLTGKNVDLQLLKTTLERNENIEVVNEYGVTETAEMATIHRHQERDEGIDIGLPGWNTQVHVLNSALRLQPVGVAGELCIAGVGVARGYLNKPALTGEKFVDSWYGRVFRTGHLARRLPGGNLEFLGPIDLQKKTANLNLDSKTSAQMIIQETKLLKKNFMVDGLTGIKKTEKCEDITKWLYTQTWKKVPFLDIKNSPGEKASGIKSQAGSWLLFNGAGSLGEVIEKRLHERGDRVFMVNEGELYYKIDDNHYEINPCSANHYRLLFEDIRKSEACPARILHLWNVEPWVKGNDFSHFLFRMDFEKGFYSMLHIARGLEACNVQRQVKIGVVSCHMLDVTGQEDIYPGKSALLGPLTVIPQEYPNITCCCIDIDAQYRQLAEENGQYVDYLLTEIDPPLDPSPDGNDEVKVEEFAGKTVEKSGSCEFIRAFRGGSRYVRFFESYPVEVSKNDLLIKAGGVYLITGGLGHLGLLIARYLAENYQAKLIFVGRTAFPERDVWNDVLADPLADSFVAARIQALREIEALGSTVLVCQADVTNLESLQEAVRCGEEKFGSLNGLFHAAGVVGMESFRPIAMADENSSDNLFQAKVYGVVNIEEVLREKELDFCMFTSSISTLLGGVGSTAFSAANSVMDALVRRHNRQKGVPWITVNFENFFKDGNISGVGTGSDEYGKDTTDFSITPAEILKVLPFLLTRNGTQQCIVSTGNLDDRMRT